jgi:hypothetical protein
MAFPMDVDFLQLFVVVFSYVDGGWMFLNKNEPISLDSILSMVRSCSFAKHWMCIGREK